MSDEETTFKLGEVEGRIAAPADLSLRHWLLREYCPAGAMRAAAGVALCWQSRWPWGERPKVDDYGWSVMALGRAVTNQLLGAGVSSEDLYEAGVVAWSVCGEGIVRPPEVVKREDFTDPAQPEGGDETS